MKKFAAALLTLLPLVSPAAHACAGLEVTDGWIRIPPPGASMTAAYARLRNAGASTFVIDRVSGKAFAGAELHRSLVENGMHRMVHGALAVAPGATTALEPGGWHLMLFEPPALVAGTRQTLSFHCGDAVTRAAFEVRAP